MTKKSKYEPLFEKLKASLPPVFKKSFLDKALFEVLYSETEKKLKTDGLDLDSLDEWSRLQMAGEFENTNQRKGLYRLIKSQLREVEYKTHGSIEPAKVYSFQDDVDGLDFANAFAIENMYYTNLSAIYIHELIDQKPLSHYLCKEVHSGSKGEYNYDEDMAKMTFRKKARVSSRYISYKDTRVYFLEKQNVKNIGVEEIKIKKKGLNEYHIQCTDLERTFIDSIISPQYSGGVGVILTAFRKCELNLNNLLTYYREMDPVYPYWQKIGFILDLMGKDKESKNWKKFFEGEPMKKFFIDREYRSDWLYNEKWAIYYPAQLEGMINE